MLPTEGIGRCLSCRRKPGRMATEPVAIGLPPSGSVAPPPLVPPPGAAEEAAVAVPRLQRQPFFEDKNRAFWLLQSIGWGGYFVLRTLSGIANSQGFSFVIHTALLTATGYSMTLLMGAVFRRL